jgi:hypothetical protein
MTFSKNGLRAQFDFRGELATFWSAQQIVIGSSAKLLC